MTPCRELFSEVWQCCNECNYYRKVASLGIIPACMLKKFSDSIRENKKTQYREYIITGDQLTELEETGSWNLVREIAKQIRTAHEVKNQEVRQP